MTSRTRDLGGGVSVVWLDPADIEPEDVRLLHEVLKLELFDLEPIDIARMAQDGKVHILRFQHEDYRCVIVVQVNETGRQQRELFLWLMASETFKFKYFKKVDDALVDIAKAFKASLIRFGTTRPEIAKLYERKYGFTKHSVNLYKEV